MDALRNKTILAGALGKWRQRMTRAVAARADSRPDGRTTGTTLAGQAGWELIVRHQMAFDFSQDGMFNLCAKLELLHDAASIGRVEMLTSLPPDELRAWLREIIFVARETLQELDSAPGEAMWN